MKNSRTIKLKRESGNIHNRRSDYAVRSAINDIQQLLFDPKASAKIFPILLEHLTAITKSDCSTCFLTDSNSINSNPQQKLYELTNNKQTHFIHTEILHRWVQQKTLPIGPTFFNGPIPKNYQELLPNPEKIHSLTILPIINQGNLHSICILGKRSGDYPDNLSQRLAPLLSATICTLQSADTIKEKTLHFEPTISNNHYLNSLLSSSPIAALVVSANRSIVVANPSAYDIFGLPNHNNQLINENIRTLLPKFESLFQWSNQRSPYGDDQPVTGPQVWKNQVALRTDGTPFLVDMTVFRYTHDEQHFTTLQIQDVTTTRKNADDYQQVLQQFNALTHIVHAGIIRVDAAWNCVYANEKWHELSGLVNEETIGQRWISAFHSNEIESLLEDLDEALQIGKDYQKEIRLISPLGKIRWVDFHTRVLFDNSGSAIGFLGTLQDITERLIHKEKLRHITEHDSLTGLASRSLFQERLEQAFYISKRDRSSVSVFFLDLDGFKDINDTLGHDIGDLLLKKVSKRLIKSLQHNDTVARFGGDSFVILLDLNKRVDIISNVAKKIIDAIAKPYILNNHEVFMTISIGIANGTSLNSSPKQILKQADAALYLAKREGKNNFQLFSANLDYESQQRVTLANQLHYAISHHRYQLLYQPIADMNTQKIVGYEALLRFKNDDDKIVSPKKFIPILEETGMMIEAGKWVIEESCRQLRDWQVSGKFPENGFLSFNVSPKQLLDDSIISTIVNACRYYSIKPHYLVMEITETVIISKPKKVERILKKLKKIGLRFAMDDFGTGYSSLSYLQQYPFDHIKIDRSFVENLLTVKNDAKIIKAIISLAQSLGLKVTAEGVADEESLEQLRKFGADHYQGYLLGKPNLPDNIVREHSTDTQKGNIIPIHPHKT